MDQGDGVTLWCSPGLGSQRVLTPILRRFSSAFRDALETGLQQAAAVGADVRPVLMGDSETMLTRTLHAFPSVLLVNHAVMEALRAQGVAPSNDDVMLGISFGELSALQSAGAISATDALRVARGVGLAIEEVVPFNAEARAPMAVVMGLAEHEVRHACRALRRRRLNVEVGNYLAADRVVISGDPDAVAEASAQLRAPPVCEVLPLRTGAPFHSTLLRGVLSRAQKREEVAGVQMGTGHHVVLSNLGGEPIAGTREALWQSISHQLTAKVMLPAVLQRAWDRGVRRVVCLDVTGKGVLSVVQANATPERPFQVLDPRVPEHADILRRRAPH